MKQYRRLKNHPARMSILHIFLFLYIILSAPVLFAEKGIKLTETKTVKLFLEFKFSTFFIFNSIKYNSGFQADYASIGLNGTIYDTLDFMLSVNPLFLYSYYSGDTMLLQDIYLDYRPFHWLGIRMGQFKVPFGEERFLNSAERPYIDHFICTKKLTPGRDQGIMLYGKDLAGTIDYSTGYFNGQGIKTIEMDITESLIAGKIKVVFGKDFCFFAGINAAYQFNRVPNMKDGFFTGLDLKFAKFQKLIFLFEFIEEYNVSTISGLPAGASNGFLSFFSYRIYALEPFLAFEKYDFLPNIQAVDDCMSGSIGLKLYLLKNKLTSKLVYNLVYYENLASITHAALVLFQLKL